MNTIDHHHGNAIKTDILLDVDEPSACSTTAQTASLPGESPVVSSGHSPLSIYPRVCVAMPGIDRSTGALRKLGINPVSWYHRSTPGAMPPKTHLLQQWYGCGCTLPQAHQSLQFAVRNVSEFVFSIAELDRIPSPRPSASHPSDTTKHRNKMSLNYKKNVSFLLTGSADEIPVPGGCHVRR